MSYNSSNTNPFINNNNSYQDEKITKINRQTDEVKVNIIRSLDAMMERGEKINILEEKSQDLLEESIKFEDESKKLKCNFIKSHYKFIFCGVITTIISILIIYYTAK